jgi:hypothetical protein
MSRTTLGAQLALSSDGREISRTVLLTPSAPIACCFHPSYRVRRNRGSSWASSGLRCVTLSQRFEIETKP